MSHSQGQKYWILQKILVSQILGNIEVNINIGGNFGKKIIDIYGKIKN